MRLQYYHYCYAAGGADAATTPVGARKARVTSGLPRRGPKPTRAYLTDGFEQLGHRIPVMKLHATEVLARFC